MKRKKPILIVGGGIGGMTAALALAKRHIATVVLEQAPQFREAGAGIQFCPNTFKMLDFLGVAEAFREIAIFPENLCYSDGLTLDPLVRLPLGNEIVSHFKHPFGSFHREDVLKVFVRECQKSPLITLITSAKVTHVEEQKDLVVAKTEKKDTYEGDALIGCDGIWSIVRRFIIGNDPPRLSKQIIYRGVVGKEKMPSGLNLDDISHYVRPNAHLVYYPIGKNGQFNISAIFQSDRTPDYHESKGNKDELFEWFKDSHPKVLEILNCVDTSRMWPLCDRDPISNWSRGKLTLLGDSAHATLPYLTSGAGMAVEDACVLANEINKHGNDYAAAFQAYQKKRYLRAAHVQLFSRIYGDVHHSSGIARELRNTLFKKRSAEENYRWVSYLYSGIEID